MTVKHAMVLAALGLALASCGRGSNDDRGAEPEPRVSEQVAEQSAAPPVAVDPAVRDFCVRSMQHMLSCFGDEAFWDTYATTFFAANGEQTVDPERKKFWIGMQKDAVLALKRDNEFEANCDTMLSQNQLPTPDQIAVVDTAREQSCTAFGGALGWMIFGQGAFYLPRDGTTPELPPQ